MAQRTIGVVDRSMKPRANLLLMVVPPISEVDRGRGFFALRHQAFRP
jgi:hypothetical protein